MTKSPTTASAVSSLTWRTPAVVLIIGCLVAVVAFGPRSTLGFFMTPMGSANGWGRDLFAFAIALQNLLWGVGQPFSGALADRFGTVRVMWVGALLYAAGLALMSYSTTPGMLNISAGVLIGFGLSGCSFPVVLAAFGKVLPEEWRSVAFGAGTAAGSFGQFLYSPLAVVLMDHFGWQNTLLIFAVSMLLVLPFSLVLATRPRARRPARAVPQQSLKQALFEALAHRSYVLLVLGYFTCGFQLRFITVHLPSYLVDGAVGAGRRLDHRRHRAVQYRRARSARDGSARSFPSGYCFRSSISGARSRILAFISFPVTPTTCILFGAVMGLLWLSTVPPTSSLIALMFGTRWLAMLAGFAFFSHQVGGFLGVLIGGIAFERTGSYDLMWWLSILFGVLSALINLPIVEKPVVRAPAPASA